jgi:hypothetical protein
MSKEVQESSPPCDLCGRKPSPPEMAKSVNSICLCAECMKKLQVMPQKLKETVEKFLIGNVL